jgi:F-type H+-transporting ATPase subunit a
MPLVLTLFLFVLLCNLISLVPFGIALTSHLILILFLSITLCVSIFSIGVIKHNVNFFKNFIPECPFILVPILIPIEIFSYLIRMFSLAIRLAANILAGHTLVYIISGFILKTCSLKS